MNIFRRNIRPGDFGSITSMEFEILLSLAGGDLHGYAIIQDIGERSRDTLTVRPGTLYRAISRLLDAGLIEEVAARRGEDASGTERASKRERSGASLSDGRAPSPSEGPARQPKPAPRAPSNDQRRRYYAMTKAGREAARIESQRLARQLETARARKLLKTKA